MAYDRVTRIGEAIEAMECFSDLQLGLEPDHVEIAALPSAAVDRVLSLTMGDWRKLHRAEITLHQLISEASAFAEIMRSGSDYARLTMVENFPTSDIAVRAAYDRLQKSLAVLAKAGA